ncbi:MAG: hypothetical protein QW543_03230 [Sulfolobales archaeon]
MPVLVGRGRLTRILYDMKMLRRRLELLEVRLERSLESMKSREPESSIIRSYSNAIRQIRFVIYALEALEVKLESILALNAMTQDLVIVREVLKELSRRVRSLPEVAAILDDIGDDIGDIMTEVLVDVDQQAMAVRREVARKILEEVEKFIEADNSKASQIAS